MTHVTITYDQQNENRLQQILSMLHASYLEVPSKQCVNAIPGLISRSFKLPTAILPLRMESLLYRAPVWFKYGLKPAALSATVNMNVEEILKEISFGYFTSTDSYSWDKVIRDAWALRWKINSSGKYLAVAYTTNGQPVELRLTAECLDKYFIILPEITGVHMLILPLTASPRCYDAPSPRSQYYTRRLTFADIDGACLADSSTVCLQFTDRGSLAVCTEFLSQVLQLECYIGTIHVSPLSNRVSQCNVSLFDFWSAYAYQMLLTVGHRIKNRIAPATVQKIHQLSYVSRKDQFPYHRCYLKLLALYYRAQHNRFFDINEEFDRTQPIPPGIVMDKWSYVPRIYLTAYGVYPLPIKPMRGNRVLRERQRFGPAENFCRVIIRDVDLDLSQKDYVQMNEAWIKNLITGQQQIIVGGRAFDFLLCSNSQLRDRSFWFHAPYNGCNATHIREWMGDFSHERCVGSHIARMALSLTGTTETITLLPHQIELIKDISDKHGRVFTDGVGKISPEALKQALLAYNPDLIEEGYMPVVIQARLNGIKGIFVLAPDLQDRGILIQYRPSQCKFRVDHNKLEIVKHSSSGMAFLNRQVIILLENMGVPESIFLKLQNKARQKISMSLLANKSAQRTLEQNVRSYDWERMYKSGVQLTQEPFVRSLLLLLAQERLKRLKERSHVQISLSDGRMLLGVVDETNSLIYGQVFIQLRDLDGKPQVLTDRKILVTKNPAHFPGDIRILEAVDHPNLRHLQECIVFPAEGRRPHPNEISGSDLDGDEYWACWNEELVQYATQQHPAANFDSAGKTKHDGEITISVIADFLYKYLTSDALGVLSNRHLACCALHGANHNYSRQLAKVISEAVDFPKTGVLPKAPKDIKLDRYPDFMENKHKPFFISKSSVGSMYRQVKIVWEIHSKWQETIEEQLVQINPHFLMPGYEDYVARSEHDYQYYASRINTIVSIYRLKNEYELITGCHSCSEEEKKNNDSVETASLEFRHLLQEMRQRFAADNLSYAEQLSKTSAWYYVAYKTGSILSFGWIMNRLMSDIIKLKHLPQEEHQAWKQIGKALYRNKSAHSIAQLARTFNMGHEGLENPSETERLGCQFLKIIEQTSSSDKDQEYAHNFLIFLHRVALNIV